MSWEYTTEVINYVPREDGYDWQIKNKERTFAVQTFPSILEMAGEEGWEAISIVPIRSLMNDDGSSFVIAYLVFYRRPRTTPFDTGKEGDPPFFLEIKSQDDPPF